MLKLNYKQIEKISEVFSDLANIMMGLSVLPFALGISGTNLIFRGLIFGVFFYFVSILLLNKKIWIYGS